MSTSSRLAAHRSAAASGTPITDLPTPADQPGEDEDHPTSTTKEKDMPIDEDAKAAIDAARTEGQGTGFKAATERMNAVFASEHYAGREALAQSMLASDKLSADDIIAHLAAAPKIEAPAPGAELTEEQRLAAAEEAGRREMQDALSATGNSGIDAGGGGQLDDKAKARAASDATWNKAYGLDKGVK